MPRPAIAADRSVIYTLRGVKLVFSMKKHAAVVSASRRYTIAAVCIALLFLFLGALWIDQPGLYYDEVYFVWASYPDPAPGSPGYFEILGRPMKLMVVPYTGALKGWVYRILFQVFPGSAAMARLPVLLLGAVAILLLYWLISRVADRRVALAAALLAAADSTFLLTTRLDWGPVAIQRFGLLAGCCLLVKWHRGGRGAYLAAGFFVFGLGAFDKLSFLWLLAALAAVTLALFPKLVLRRRTVAWATPAAVAFLIGFLPVILYYAEPTAARSSLALDWDSDSWQEKVGMLRGTLDGTAVPNAIVIPQAAARGREVSSLERAISLVGGPERPALFFPALVVAVCLLPLTLRGPYRELALFSAGYCALAWAIMFLVQEAGSVHHLALVYPFPHVFVAGSAFGIVEGVRRPGFRRVLRAVLVLAALLIVGDGVRLALGFHMRLARQGERAVWSSAIYDLHESLLKMQPAPTVTLDWGIAAQIRFLSRATTSIHEWSSMETAPQLAGLLEIPEVLYLGFAENPGVPGVTPLFRKLVRSRGYDWERVATIADRTGRPMYYVHRVTGHAGAAPGP